MGNSKNLTNIKSKKFHYTYQIKCFINNKTYIGRHSTDNIRDNYFGSGKILKKSILKHNINNFKLEILDFFDSYKEVVEEERFLVTKEWCKLPTNYNLVEGGENPIMYGSNNPAWKGGISKDPSYRNTGVAFNFKGGNNPRYGYKYSNKEKEDMIFTQVTRIPLTIFGMGYKSLREASKLLNRSRDYIKYRCESDKFKDWYYKEEKQP